MKINDLGIELDSNFMYSYLVLVKLDEALKEACDSTVQYMKQIAKLGSYTNEADWINELLYRSEDEIVRLIGVDHWYALMTNYGTGSKMDRGNINPHFDAYVNSPQFNEARKKNDLAVMGRGLGKEYISITGEKKVGKKSQKTNLEKTRNNKTGMMYFTAQEPKDWFEDAIAYFKYMLDYFVKIALGSESLNTFLKARGD